MFFPDSKKKRPKYKVFCKVGDNPIWQADKLQVYSLNDARKRAQRISESPGVKIVQIRMDGRPIF